jgi:hypothetical protein
MKSYGTAVFSYKSVYYINYIDFRVLNYLKFKNKYHYFLNLNLF